MSRFLPVLFGTLMLTGIGAYDYFKVMREQAMAAELGLAAPQGYLASLRTRLLPGAVQTVPVTLAGLLGDAPRGWQRRPYDPADGERLTGQTLQPAEALRSTTNDMLHRLRLSAPVGLRMAETFEKADSLVVISLTIGDAPMADGAVLRADHATVRGLPLALLEQVDEDATTGTRADAPYRRLVANLGGAAQLAVMTNATDADLAPVLATLDLPGLLQGLGIVLPGVSGEKPVFAGTSAIKTPLALPEEEEGQIVAGDDAPKGPCVRRGTVLSCE